MPDLIVILGRSYSRWKNKYKEPPKCRVCGRVLKVGEIAVSKRGKKVKHYCLECARKYNIIEVEKCLETAHS